MNTTVKRLERLERMTAAQAMTPDARAAILRRVIARAEAIASGAPSSPADWSGVDLGAVEHRNRLLEWIDHAKLDATD